ncbi:MAG: class I SAM-dependent methyltransferase [Bacteroidetes bacterium]|nr:class I SAM-dependent methyltransferase [Bacteroidota bacterium]
MYIKAYISNNFRKLKLLGFADWLRFIYIRWKNKKLNSTFLKNNPAFKFPPDFYLYETYVLNYEDYFNDGFLSATEIIKLLSEHNLIFKQMEILDWGCGPGRTIRHVPKLLPDAIIYGTDYNPKYVSWCRSNIPGVRFSLNSIVPPLNFESLFFDLV